MNDVPFGFGPPSDDDPDGRTGGSKRPGGSGDGPDKGGGGSGADPGNPFAALFGAMSPADMGAAFQRIGQLLAFEGGPVNWDLARDVARQTVSAGSDRSVTSTEQAAVEQAVRIAEVWLDPVTTLPAGTTKAVAWSRAEWVEATQPVWRQLVEPVAGRVVEAMSEVLPAEMQAASGPLLGILRSMGGAMFGAQIGQALGSLASEVVSSTDIGLPLGPAGEGVLLPANVAVFGGGLGVDADQVRLYLALRETAHHRLFGHVPWLRAHLLGTVESYGRGIRVDSSQLEQAVSQIDPMNPESLQQALTSGMFTPEDTPQQKAALARLETALALVEGWVDAIVDSAAADKLPAAAALRETVRRRRASGGPAEQTFATLVGLELRPRRLRDAARLWTLLADARGASGRDATWEHPDLLPTADDLDDPEAFVERSGTDLTDLGGIDFGDSGGEARGSGGDGDSDGDGNAGGDTPGGSS